MQRTIFLCFLTFLIVLARSGARAYKLVEPSNAGFCDKGCEYANGLCYCPETDVFRTFCSVNGQFKSGLTLLEDVGELEYGACAGACYANGACKYFEYFDQDAALGQCRLMAGTPDAASYSELSPWRTSSLGCLLEQAGNCINKADYPGDVSGVVFCALGCIGKDLCQQWTFDVATQECKVWFTEPTEPIPSSAYSGSQQCELEERGCWHDQTSIVTLGELPKVSVSSAILCYFECSRTPGCEVWSFEAESKICRLAAEAISSRNSNGFVSGTSCNDYQPWIPETITTTTVPSTETTTTETSTETTTTVTSTTVTTTTETSSTATITTTTETTTTETSTETTIAAATETTEVGELTEASTDEGRTIIYVGAAFALGDGPLGRLTAVVTLLLTRLTFP